MKEVCKVMATRVASHTIVILPPAHDLQIRAGPARVGTRAENDGYLDPVDEETEQEDNRQNNAERAPRIQVEGMSASAMRSFPPK